MYSEAARNNLNRFKEAVFEKQGQDRTLGKNEKRVYSILINKKTGEFRFLENLQEVANKLHQGHRKEDLSDWKNGRIVICLTLEGARFDVEGIKQLQDLQETAQKVLEETLSILNSRSQELGNPSSKTLSEIEVLKNLSFPEGALEGWMGSLTRVEAEKKLEGKGEGVYLFRKPDSVVMNSALQFAEANEMQVRPYVLSFVEKEGKIKEYLVLETPFGWTLYHDDPDLKDRASYRYFPSLQELLRGELSFLKQICP